MKKYLALGALVVVLTAIGAGALIVAGGDDPGPDAVASGWASAMAHHDWAKVCSYEAPAYAGPHCADAYEENVTGASAAAGVDLVKDFQHVGKCAIIGDLAYCFLTAPNLQGQVPVMELEHGKNGSWHVTQVS